MLDTNDTIAAIGTAPGGGLRGMVRMSGPCVLECLAACFHPGELQPNFRESGSPCVSEGNVQLVGELPIVLPCELLLWPGQRSYTKQPTAELHTLGSPPLLEQLLRTVCHWGARLAEPGEFTLRAFLAGRLDLTQAEAVLGVIDSGSETDLRVALSQLAGGLSQPLSQLREQLLQLLAELEAGLDFVEEDIEFISAQQIRTQLSAALTLVSSVVVQLGNRAGTSHLPRVVLSGQPNAGKSSLFNALVERYAPKRAEQRALVSAQAGTTRDFVTAEVHLSGMPCELVDTAGVQELVSAEGIDQLAREATEQQRQRAQVVLNCEDASGQIEPKGIPSNTIRCWTKVDLRDLPLSMPLEDVACSSVDGRGLEHLAQRVAEMLNAASGETNNSLVNTATRCADSLRQARDSLARALELVTVEGGEELIAAEVRASLQALGQVVGAVYTDDILDRVFGQFCIGK